MCTERRIKMKKSRIIAALLLSAMCVFTSCKKQETKPEPKEEQTETVNTEDNKTVEEQPEVKEPEVSPYKNPLTGLPTTQALYNNRPVAIMINNIHLAMPQMGISKADIIYEVLEEGGITRLMALFQDYATLPETGSIRSARDYFVDLSDAHNAMYVHCGGSTYAKKVIAERKTEDIDAMYNANFYRSKERAKTMAFEHTLMITGEGLASDVKTLGYKTTIDTNAQPLKFKDADSDIQGSSAKHIDVPFSLALSSKPYALSTLDYDEKSKVYLKGQYETTHIDGGTGEQLSFKNVIVLECEQHVIAGDPLHCLSVNFTGSGKGYYATNGVIKPIKWVKSSRTSSYTLLEEDGSTALILNPGKSYIAIVPSGTTISAS